MLYGIPVGYPDLWLVKESPHTLQTKLWSTVETPFLQVPCTGAHNRNSGTSSFKTNRAHGNNCIKNVLAWLYIATGFPDTNVDTRNHARRWQQQRWRVCHQKNWKWVYFLNILNTFCGFGQTQLSSSGAFSGDVYTSKPKPVISGQLLAQHSWIILVVNPEK